MLAQVGDEVLRGRLHVPTLAASRTRSETMPDLKPMGLGEILDGALTIFRRHFVVFVKLGVVALWFPVALNIYVNLAGGQQQHLFLAFVANVVQYFAGLFLTAAAIRVISDSYMGQEPQ